MEDRYVRNPAAAGEYGVALATLDDDPGVSPSFHSFVGSKASWFAITDDLPQYAAHAEATASAGGPAS